MPDPAGSIIGAILKVAESLFGLRSKLAAARLERKSRVADYLAGLAQTIEDASASLKQSIYPHGKCQELFAHSQNMISAVGDLIGQQQAAEFGHQLENVWQIEQLHAQLSSVTPEERDRSLQDLDRAAGHFRAVAAYVRVSP